MALRPNLFVTVYTNTLYIIQVKEARITHQARITLQTSS